MSARALLVTLRLGAILLIIIIVPLLWRLMIWLPWHLDCLLPGGAAFAFAYRFERAQS